MVKILTYREVILEEFLIDPGFSSFLPLQVVHVIQWWQLRVCLARFKAKVMGV